MSGHSKDEVLPFATRLVIFSGALVQALILYLCSRHFHLEPNDGDTLTPLRLALSTLALCLPTVMALSLRQLEDKRFWQQLGLLALLQCAVLAWGLYGSQAPNIHLAPVWLALMPSLLLMCFVLLPWLQARQQHGSFRVPYADLFESAWQNTLSLLLALFFTLTCWLLLMLWAGLFNLLGIDFFWRLFTNPLFFHPVLSLLFTLGILIARQQRRAVQVVRQIKFALFKGLLPLLALIALLFVLSLPFSGLEPLWQTRRASALLTCLMALLVLFTNAVWQDGRADTPYPPLLRRLVEAALLLLPVYAALALYALWLRIDQYGFTVTRFFALLVLLLISGYALGYAFAVLRRGKRWLAAIAPVNKGLSWALIALAVLANSPLLDAYRISAASQVARLGSDMDEKILLYLRFDNGRAGYQALQKLQAERPADSAKITEILAKTSRWTTSPRNPLKARITDTDSLRQHLLIAEGSPLPDELWWKTLLSGDLKPRECVRQNYQCVLRVLDLDADGENDVLLCELDEKSWRTGCWIHAKEDGSWRNQGYASFFRGDFKEPGKTLEQLLKSGTLNTVRGRWPMLSLEGSEAVDITSAR